MIVCGMNAERIIFQEPSVTEAEREWLVEQRGPKIEVRKEKDMILPRMRDGMNGKR